jgi:hypothetical protein
VARLQGRAKARRGQGVHAQNGGGLLEAHGHRGGAAAGGLGRR